MKITPLHIEIMLHYNIGGSDYRDGDFSASAVREYINQLHEENLLEAVPEYQECTLKYFITDKGLVWIDCLCKTPMPIQKWVIV